MHSKMRVRFRVQLKVPNSASSIPHPRLQCAYLEGEKINEGIGRQLPRMNTGQVCVLVIPPEAQKTDRLTNNGGEM